MLSLYTGNSTTASQIIRQFLILLDRKTQLGRWYMYMLEKTEWWFAQHEHTDTITQSSTEVKGRTLTCCWPWGCWIMVGILAWEMVTCWSWGAPIWPWAPCWGKAWMINWPFPAGGSIYIYQFSQFISTFKLTEFY